MIMGGEQYEQVAERQMKNAFQAKREGEWGGGGRTEEG